ncbi:MAG: tripartite tricarboxylate transporter substrate binding protein [Pseudolabrys sp.]
MRRWQFIALISAAAVSPTLARAQPAAALSDDYPVRPVTILCPYAAGGGTDILARILSQGLSERFGKPFIVEDRPGAGTMIAANMAAKAAPDGYTLLMGTSTPLAINATLHAKLPYDPVRDFVPLALVADVPSVLVVNPSVPVRTTGELIKFAKANPNKLSFGSSGPGSPHHLTMELFKTMTGTELMHVPYKGSVSALTDVVAGVIPLMFVGLAPSLNLIRAGSVRALGVSSKTLVPELPDVPPIADDVPGFEAVAWQMLVAPAATPGPVVDKLHEALREIEAQPEIKRKIKQLGMIPIDTPPVADMQTYIKSEVARWGRVVQKSGASVD